MAKDSTAEIVIKSIFMSVFILLAILGNIFVCIAIKKYKRLKTMTNYYVFNLAIADLLYGLTGMPLLLVTTVTGEWVLGHALCQLSGTLQTLFILVSIWTLCLIGINRFIAVSKHASYKSIYRKKRVFISIAIVWCVACIVSVCPLLGWSSIKEGDNFCTINGKDNISYSVFVIIFAYIAPLVVLSGLYTKIFFLLREHEKRMMEIRGGGSFKSKSESEYDSVELSSTYKIENTIGTLGDIRFDNTNDELSHRTSKNDYHDLQNKSIPQECSSSENGGEVNSNSNENEQVGLDLKNPRHDNEGENNVALESQSKRSECSPASDQRSSPDENVRSSRTASGSAIHLILDTNQTVNATFHSDTNEGSLKPRKNRTLSGIANAIKKRRSTTSKKIKKFRSEAKITKMLFVVVAVFFVCWTPLVIGTVLYAVNAEPKNFNLLSLGFLVASMNSICNPIIYAFMNESFRNAFRDMFAGCRSPTEEPRTES